MSEITFNCPHCNESLKVPTDMLGQKIECPSCNGSIQLPEPEPQSPIHLKPQQVPKKKIVIRQSKPTSSTRACPYCGEQILRGAQKCKHCGEFLKRTHDVRTNVKQGAIIGAVVCFTVGTVLMFLSLWSFIIYSPLFFAAFILSIVAMSQRRVAGGLIILLLTLIVPPVLFLGLGAVRNKDALLSSYYAARDEASLRVRSNVDASKPTSPTPPVEHWTSAANAIRHGDVQVRITAANIGKVPLNDMFGDSDELRDDYLTITLEIYNFSATKKLEFKTWRDGRFWGFESMGSDVATLADEHGNTYLPVSLAISTPAGGVDERSSVYPGKAITDVLVFEVPVKTVKWLRLKLPAGNHGGEGTLRFEIPASMIRQ